MAEQRLTHLDPERLIRTLNCVPHHLTQTPEAGLITVDTLAAFSDLLRHYVVPVIYYEQVTVPAFSAPAPEDLTGRAGQVMEVTLYAPVPGALLAVTVWTDWAEHVEALIDVQDTARRSDERQARKARAEAFEARLRQELPLDAEFVRIARTRRPPITLLRQRVTELYPADRVLVPGARTTILEVVTAIRTAKP